MNKEIYAKIVDKAFREKLIANPHKYSKELGYDIANDIDIKIIKNTKEIFYVALAKLDIMENLEQIQAAGNTASCAGSASTLGSVTSTVSSGATASTLGTTSSEGDSSVMAP